MRLLVGGVAVLFATGACTAAGVATDDAAPTSAVPSSSATQPAVADPSGDAEWDEPSAYSFSLSSLCGERNLIGSFRVIVESGAVVAAEGTDWRGRTTLRALGLGLVPTLGDLLEEIEVAEQEGADSVDVEFDPIDGYPSNISIDWFAEMIDDEACYDITDFVTE